MRKIYLSIFTILTCFSVNAQTLTVSNHAPMAGDMYSTYQCDSTGILVGASGPGSLWDYSSIVTHSSVISNYTASASTDTNYPNADIVANSSTGNVLYFKATPSDLKYFGGNIAIGSISGTINYTSPAVYAAYPMSLNTATAGTIGGSISALGNSGTFTGNSSVIADGTGVLILPTKTFTNVMRVVTSQTINFTISFATGTAVQVTYDYYSGLHRTPLFVITTATVNSMVFGVPQASTTQNFVYIAKDYQTLNINENKQALINLDVFPNPSSTTINFITKSVEAKQILIYDFNGKLVEKQNFNNGKLKLDLTEYANGLYTYSVMDDNHQILKSDKIMVSH